VVRNYVSSLILSGVDAFGHTHREEESDGVVYLTESAGADAGAGDEWTSWSR